MEPFCLIIDGGRVPTEEHFEVLNPAKEEPAGLAPLGRKKDLDDAVAAAERAFKKWREAPKPTGKPPVWRLPRRSRKTRRSWPIF